MISSGAAANPILNITSPTAGTNIKWKPIISWGTDVLCQYKIDGGNYTSVLCSNNGSDIPRPSANTSHTIFFRSTDSHNNITEKSILFTYDNTQAIDTDCSTPLDESTHAYYYLNSNVANCSITASTTVRGTDGSGNFYIIGNSWGSMLAIEYALKYQQHIKGMVIGNMMASIPDYANYNKVLRKEMRPSLVDSLQNYEAKGMYKDPTYTSLVFSEFYTKHLCRLPEWPNSVMRSLQHVNEEIYVMMQGHSEFTVSGRIVQQEGFFE